MAFNKLLIAVLLTGATAALTRGELSQRLAAAEERIREKAAKTNAVARGRAPAAARLPLRKNRLGGVVPAGTEDCSAHKFTDSCYGGDKGTCSATCGADQFTTEAGGECALCPDEASGCLGGVPEIEGAADVIDCLACCFPGDPPFTLPGPCASCGISDNASHVTDMIDCLTCEEGYEIVPVHDDCTGFCVESGASVDYFKSLGFGDLATSTCTAVLDCYDDEERTAMESLPTDGTNDFLPGEGGDGSYSYSYSYGIVDFCTDDTGFLDCLGAALLSGDVTEDELDAAFDAVTSGFEDDGWSADTCEEFQQEPILAKQCGSWTLGVCGDEFKAWVSCIFTTTFARGGLDCTIDCDAIIGTPSRPSTMPPTEPGGSTRPPTGNDSDGALGLTTTLTAAAVVAAAF